MLMVMDPTKPWFGVITEFGRALLMTATVPSSVTVDVPSFVTVSPSTESSPVVKVAEFEHVMVTVIDPLPASWSAMEIPCEIVQVLP
mmetsp:Transcript_7044/g.12990  ORF Transcript_7044/g.12990 Transcript_7044/m.12990 type:complete len:87 (-) Transcript_7044:465-725(-)